MIRTVKSCLTKSIGKTSLIYDELTTLLVKIETLVSSQPLTCVEDDQDGTTYPLTPSHLIHWRRVANTPNAGHFEVISAIVKELLTGCDSQVRSSAVKVGDSSKITLKKYYVFDTT